MTTRVVAVDWSGDRRSEDGIGPGTLWLAEVVEGRLTQLRPTSRRGTVDRILELAGADDELVAGLDVAFSYPSWFVRSLGMGSVEELWCGMDRARARRPPFWGWAGSHRPAADPERPLLRRTDAVLPPAKSPFQVAGPGSVGTGTLTAFAHLARLVAAGVAVWPFAVAGRSGSRVAGRVAGPVVVEVYPRRFTVPALVKSNPVARAAWWAAHGPAEPTAAAALVAASEDAFDAAVSALALWDRRHAARRLAPVDDPDLRLEGWVFDVPLPA